MSAYRETHVQKNSTDFEKWHISPADPFCSSALLRLAAGDDAGGKKGFGKEDVSCLLPAAVVNLWVYMLLPFRGTEIEISMAL